MPVAADTSSLVAYFGGEAGEDVRRVDEALLHADLRLPPAALAELLSDPRSHARLAPIVTNWPLLETGPDYWTRVAITRGILISKGLRARLPDALIAQSCLDHDVPLITRDVDFRHFEKHCGLKLA